MISVITPTYNRGYIIDNLFNSLKSQTSYDFEWIVIDDGSTDDTYDKLKSMSGENVEFPITIIGQQNKGKHCAVNTGVAKAKGEFVFIVDSDDMLTRCYRNRICPDKRCRGNGAYCGRFRFERTY